MAGHSKWKNIKHKKEREDAKKGKIFTKFAKEIAVVARDGGPDPASNARLRLLIDKAKSVNMPKENIDRAIKKGSGKQDTCNYEQIFYEGYGLNGVAVIIEALTDNKNRTAAELRHFFNKNGGTLAENGAVAWMFEHKGMLEVVMGNHSEDALLEMLLALSVDDVEFDEPGIANVYCPVKELDALRKQIEALGLQVKGLSVVWTAKEDVTFQDPEHETQAISYMETLEDLDDVQNVYANF